MLGPAAPFEPGPFFPGCGLRGGLGFRDQMFNLFILYPN